MKTLIKNGRIVTAIDDYKADILIEDERVSVIGNSLQMEADHTINAAGKLVIPGGIDPHTHMELPFGGTQSSDDFFTGTRAAAFGGTTTVGGAPRCLLRPSRKGCRPGESMKGGSIARSLARELPDDKARATRCESRIGIALAWMGVGDSKPASRTARCSGSDSANSSKVSAKRRRACRQAEGVRRPWTRWRSPRSSARSVGAC